jgi:hypothetical protein
VGCTLYNLIKFKPPFSGMSDSDITEKIKSGRYERIERGLDYSDGLIDLIEIMMSVVWNYLFVNLYINVYSIY